jgi:hypothetical protein
MKNLPATTLSGSQIPYVRLLVMNRDYQFKQDLLTRAIGKPETQSIWFAKDEKLVEFLQGLLNDESVSGIRVYLCNYSPDTIPPGTTVLNYSNKLTVGMVGTKQNGEAHPDHPEAGTTKQFLAIDPYNHGKICPPDTCPNDDPGNP